MAGAEKRPRLLSETLTLEGLGLWYRSGKRFRGLDLKCRLYDSAYIEDRSIPEPNTGCWIWLNYVNPRGYGTIGSKFAHRISYEASAGPIPDGLVVRHSCDLPSCVNPSHLSVGTQADNLNDMARRGRGCKAKPSIQGEANSRSKLTDEAVIAIRSDLRPYRAIAMDNSISLGLVHSIKARKKWAHL